MPPQTTNKAFEAVHASSGDTFSFKLALHAVRKCPLARAAAQQRSAAAAALVVARTSDEVRFPPALSAEKSISV